MGDAGTPAGKEQVLDVAGVETAVGDGVDRHPLVVVERPLVAREDAFRMVHVQRPAPVADPVGEDPRAVAVVLVQDVVPDEPAGLALRVHDRDMHQVEGPRLILQLAPVLDEVPVAEGDLDVQIDVDSKDEIGVFARTFNNMTAAVKDAKRLMEENTFEMIASLSKALEARDPYTEGHSLRVAEYSVALGKLIGLEQRELDLIYSSGLLHDVGKIGIRDSVLLKDSRLTDEEFEIIKTHPVVGHEIVKNLHFLKDH